MAKTPRPVFVLRLRPAPGCDVYRELRIILKRLLRQHRFRCLSVSEEREAEPGGEGSNAHTRGDNGYDQRG